LKPFSLKTPDDHQVVSENPKEAFAILGRVNASSKCGPEPSFVLGYCAFDLPALAVDSFGKPAVHLGAIAGLRRSLSASSVEWNDGRWNPQFFTAQAMVVFSIVRGVGQYAMERNMGSSLRHRFGKLGRIVAGSAAYNGAWKQVGPGIANDGQFGPAAAIERFVAFALYVIRTGVAGFEPRGVDGPLRALVSQAKLARPLENGGEQFVKSPFFSSRCSAYHRHE
jgi:hypothetical protein